MAAGNLNAVRHGAQSSAKVTTAATTAKRRLLRNLGIRYSEVDPVGRALLDLYGRAVGKAILLDRYFDEHGIVNEKGEPHPACAFYFSALNTASRTLARLDGHLKQTLDHPVADLAEAGRLVRLAAVKDEGA